MADFIEGNGAQGFLAGVRDNLHNDVAATLFNAIQNGLSESAATALTARPLPADKCLIHLDMALQERHIVRFAHELADLLAHAIGGFVGDAKLAFQFLAAHAVARRDEQVDCIEPNRQGRAAVLKDRARDHYDRTQGKKSK